MELKRWTLLVVDAIFGVVGTILSLRILFQLAGANPATPFVVWVYSVGSQLMTPFRGIFANYSFGDGMVADSTAIISLAFYTVGFYLVRLVVEEIAAQTGHRSWQLPI